MASHRRILFIGMGASQARAIRGRPLMLELPGVGKLRLSRRPQLRFLLAGQATTKLLVELLPLVAILVERSPFRRRGQALRGGGIPPGGKEDTGRGGRSEAEEDRLGGRGWGKRIPAVERGRPLGDKRIPPGGGDGQGCRGGVEPTLSLPLRFSQERQTHPGL
eukprot:scaffold15844_cov112-Isochrysis_galbana.AAC.1